MSLGFMTLQELWGDDYNNFDENTGVDYTGGNRFETELQPISNNSENLMLTNGQQTHSSIVPHQQLEVKQHQQQMQPQSEEMDSIKDVLNKINDRIKRLEDMCVTRDKKIVESFGNASGNRYFDLLILIGLGILVIYVLDSILKLGKK